MSEVSSTGPMIRIAERLHLLRTDPSNVYMWTGGDGVTLVDAGLPGTEAAIVDALDELGLGPSDVTQLVLTHWHADHSGAAAAVAAWGARVCVGRADAPVVRGEVAGPPPALTPQERPLFEELSQRQPSAPPCPVHRELDDGDGLDAEGVAIVVATPGHTKGALAVHFPGLGVVLTGDTTVGSEGGLALGPFTADRAAAQHALDHLAGLGVEVVGPGHGDPVLTGGSAALRRAADAAEQVDPDEHSGGARRDGRGGNA